MSNSKKKPFQDAAKGIDDGISSLFGVLGDAITEIATRLEDGNTGAVTRDHVFETAKGPIRAHAGIKLRMGGIDQSRATDSAPAPVNPNRARSTSRPPPESKPIAYDLLEDEVEWILTADVPGVSPDDLNISQDATGLVIKTTGNRRYATQVDLAMRFTMADVTTNLRNGILTVRIKKEPQA